MTLNFNLQGAERKNLVKAISAILEAEATYLKTPSYAYDIAGYHLDRYGVLTGADNQDLRDALQERGFIAEAEEEAQAEAAEAAYEEEFAALEGNDRGEENSLTIEIPLGKFSPEKLDNLCRLVNAKETLIKAALGVDAIPIQVTEDTIKFPWHKSESLPTGDEAKALATFITLLGETALEKKRVTAKDNGLPENPKYAMRCFLLSIGMIGKEYSDTRRILLSRLEGDSSWKGGKPPKAATPTDEPRSEYEMLMEQLPEGTAIIKDYNAAESGERRIVTNEDGEKRYVVQYEDGYPRITHKP